MPKKLTNEQMAWALEWAANYLSDHGYDNETRDELRSCANQFKEAAGGQKDNKETTQRRKALNDAS